MLIRTEAPADLLAIDRLLKTAFPTEAEADLVMRLRENGKLTLSLVACSDEGEVVGHVMFTPMQVKGEEMLWQGLAPLSVHQDYRKQGIGARLVEEGLTSLRELGYNGCFVLGDPEYYQRFGFKEASEYGFVAQWELPQGVFRALPLSDDAFEGHQGVVEYSNEFSEV